MSKHDDMLVVFIGVLFLVIIGVMMLLPKNYFATSEYFRDSSFETYMKQSVGEYDTGLATFMKTPTLIGMLSADKDELFIAKRCYKYADMSIDTVIAKIDRYALGTGNVNVKCKTYRLFVSSFNQVQDVVITDIQNTRNQIGSPLKGSVYVMLSQVPLWVNDYGEFRIVNDTTRAEIGNNPVYSTKARNPDGPPPSLQKDKVLEGGEVFMYVAIFYGGYSKDDKALGVDAMDGTVLVPGATAAGMAFFAIEDADHITKADICNMECPAEAGVKCGCGSMPSVPKTSRYGDAYYGLTYPQFTDLDKGMSYSSDLINMVKPESNPNIIGGGGPLGGGLYQARCIDSSKQTGASTFATIYRINPVYRAFAANTFDIPKV